MFFYVILMERFVSQSEVQRLDSLMISINAQLDQLGQLLYDVARWPESAGKQQMIDQILRRQDEFFTLAEGVRGAFSNLGVNIASKIS